MYRAFYEGLTITWLPLGATLFFAAFFVAVLVFALGRKRSFDDVATLPLQEDKHERA